MMSMEQQGTRRDRHGRHGDAAAMRRLAKIGRAQNAMRRDGADQISAGKLKHGLDRLRHASEVIGGVMKRNGYAEICIATAYHSADQSGDAAAWRCEGRKSTAAV